MRSLYILNDTVRVVDTQHVLDSAGIHIIDQLYELDLLENFKPTNIIVKRLVYFHIIKCICDSLLRKENHVKTILLMHEQNHIQGLKEYCICEKRYTLFMKTVLRNISKVLPINFYNSAISFDCLVELHKDSGERQNVINDIRNIIQMQRVKSMEDIKKFTKETGLTFLSESYFKNIKTKNLLFV